MVSVNPRFGSCQRPSFGKETSKDREQALFTRIDTTLAGYDAYKDKNRAAMAALGVNIDQPPAPRVKKDA